MTSKRNTRRVKLDELFRYKGQTEIKDERGNVVTIVYQRVISDPDYEKARLGAIRKSREIRLALRNGESDESAAMLESLTNYSKEQKINILMVERFDKFFDSARSQANVRLPEHPGSEASLLEIEDYETALDEYNTKVGKAIQEIVDKEIVIERKKLDELSEAELEVLCAKSLENQICQNVLNGRFNELLVFYGTYQDAEYTTKYFNKLDDLDELASQVKDQLIRGYLTLTLPQEELKN
jgi:hypothetical protein